MNGRPGRPRRGWPPPTPLGFKLWTAFVAVLGLSMAAFVVWVVIRVLDILEKR